MVEISPLAALVRNDDGGLRSVEVTMPACGRNDGEYFCLKLAVVSDDFAGEGVG